MVSASGEWQQKCQVVIEPKQKVSLTVVFCPTAVRGYSGKLVIRKQDTQPSKYSVSPQHKHTHPWDKRLDLEWEMRRTWEESKKKRILTF